MDVVSDEAGSLDAGVDRAAGAAEDAQGDGGMDGLDSGLVDATVDRVGTGGVGGSTGAAGAGGFGGTSGGGVSGGTAATGGTGGGLGTGVSSGADASADVVRDSSTGSDSKDAVVIEATPPADLQIGDTSDAVNVNLDGTSLDGSVDSAPDVPVGGASDVPPSVCTINGASWAKKWDTIFTGMGVGADGTVWATGQIFKPFDFSSDTQDGGVGLASSGGADIFLAKLDPATGLAAAEFTFGAFNDDPAHPKAQVPGGVAVASGTNVGLIGRFDYEVDFSGNNSDGTGPTGNVGDAGVDFLVAGATNAPFYAVISGSSSGAFASPIKAHQVDLDTGTLMAIGSNPTQDAFAICGKTHKAVKASTNSAGLITNGTGTGGAGIYGGGMDIVVAKIDASDGHVIWGEQFGGAGDQVCESVTMDSSGNVIIAGGYTGTLSFGGTASDFPVVDDTTMALLYVAKLDGSTGAPITAQTWGTTGRVNAYSITVDKDDNIVVAGTMGADIDFGGGNAITDLGATDAFVAKLTSSLAPVWAKSFGDATSDQGAKAVATSSTGDVYIGGSFVGSMGALGLTNSNTATDAYLAQLVAADGSLKCAQQYGDTAGAQSVAAITVARTAIGSLTDSVAVGGSFSSSITFGSRTLITDGVGSSASYATRIAP
jgi:hypothetical protein